MPLQSRYTKKDIQKALVAYENGISYKKIAKDIGAHASTVHKWVKQHGIPTHRDKKFPKDVDEVAIIKAYSAGLTLPKIEERYSVSEKRIYSIIKKAKLTPRRTPAKAVLLTEKHILEIEALLVGGATQAQVAEKYGLTNRQLRKVREDNSMPSRHPNSFQRKHIVRENLFKVIDDESAYWLGVLAADGSLQNPGTISYKISAKDTDLMRQYVQFLELDLSHCYESVQITRGKPFEQIQMRFHNTEVFNTLNKIGILPCTKSSHLNINDERLLSSKFFWRGMLDGDGSIGKENLPMVNFVGTRMMCEKLSKFIDRQYAVTGYKIRKVGKHLHSISITGKNAVRVAIGLWSGSGPGLKRKRDRARKLTIRAGYDFDIDPLDVKIPRENIPEGIHVKSEYPSPYSVNIMLDGELTRLGSFKELADAKVSLNKALSLKRQGCSRLKIRKEFYGIRQLPPGVRAESGCDDAKYSCSVQIRGEKMYFGCFKHAEDASEVYRLAKELQNLGLKTHDIRQSCNRLAVKKDGFRRLKHNPRDSQS